MDTINIKLDTIINEEIDLFSRSTDKERMLSAKRLEDLLRIRKEQEESKFNRKFREEQLEQEKIDKQQRIDFEMQKFEFEKSRRHEERRWKAVNAALEGVKIGAPLIFAASAFKKVMTFEETGSIVSTVGRALVPSIFRIKF